MSENQTQNDERKLEDLPMHELRAIAKGYAIKATPTWSKEDFVMAIETRQRKSGNLAKVVTDNNTGPAPGWARIILNNQEQGSNIPALFTLNNYKILIPRNVPTDIPLELLGVINDSKVTSYFPSADGKSTEKRETLAYPYQLVSMTPGIAMRNGRRVVRPSTSEEKQSLRMKYVEIFGKFPRPVEFEEFRAAHMKRKVGLSFDADSKQIAEVIADEDEAA